MPKLTDDEVGALLRETFADKEKLVDQLPMATKRRKAPVLLAAAAVLVLLTGILYVAGDRDRETVAKAPADAAIWAAVMSEIVKKAPEGKLGPVLEVLAAPEDHAAPPEMAEPIRGPEFSAQTKARIEQQVTQPIQWVHKDGGCRNPGLTNRFVALGRIVDKGDHQEAATFDQRGCHYATWATYRVVYDGTSWKVDGLVKPMSGMAPVGGPASPLGRR